MIFDAARNVLFDVVRDLAGKQSSRDIFVSNLLLESNGFFLLEDNSFLLLEG